MEDSQKKIIEDWWEENDFEPSHKDEFMAMFRYVYSMGYNNGRLDIPNYSKVNGPVLTVEEMDKLILALEPRDGQTVEDRCQIPLNELLK